MSGKDVCRNSFSLIYGFSPKRLLRIKKKVTLGQHNLDHGNKGKRKHTIRGNEAKMWMERYFNLIGDKLPDRNQIHLPSWDNQKDIYQRYRDNMILLITIFFN